MAEKDIFAQWEAHQGRDSYVEPEAFAWEDSGEEESLSEGRFAEEADAADAQDVDISEKAFPEVTRRFETAPMDFFADPADYYKTALADEPEIANRVHALLQKLLGATDPKDRSVFRPQLIAAYWEFLRGVARKAPGRLPDPKKFLLRYNILHPNLIKPEARSFFAKLIVENELDQPIYYVDEWLKAVGTGSIGSSTTDEVKIARGNTQMKLQQLMEKAKGRLEGARALLRGKTQTRREMEDSLQKYLEIAGQHFPMEGLPGVSLGYSDGQRRAFGDIQEILKDLLKNDREFTTLFKDFHRSREDFAMLHRRIDEGDADDMLDLGAVDMEFDTLRQAAKMTVGRQGNHFPILSGEYFHSGPNDVGFRENVLSMLSLLESIDSEVFFRTHRNKANRIVPFVVLIPTYGDSGICWEPFDKRNRATSRGRIFIPMYPKNLHAALLSAVADLRWQVAKEKASHYWMEEGLTGHFYQWYMSQKLKGDVKSYFIEAYVLWITKESEGVQRLDKTVRGIFWRHIPFSQEIKDRLKTRSYVYQELCQRDMNRAMSDGY